MPILNPREIVEKRRRLAIGISGVCLILFSWLTTVAGAMPEEVDVEAQYPNYGFFLGPSMSSASSNDVEGPRGSRFGDAIGMFASFPITSMLSFRPELNYMTKGSSDGSNNVTQLAYLQLPLLFELNYPCFGGKLFLPFGASVGTLVGKTVVTAQNSYYQITYGKIKNDELSAVLGVGFAFQAWEHYRVFGMFRYDHGLTNVAAFQVAGQDAKYYSRNFSFLVGLSFTQDPDKAVFEQQTW